ncbi:MAG: site-specific integrase [Candidatus Obscuribacterales bacterium]|nr:site-specific integrase [Candidatus Obscuribacterales bacterium]
MKWKPVDFDKNEILIDAGRVFGIEGTPKTKAGRRVITMLPPVVAALKSLRGSSALVDMGRHVFLTRHGHPFNDNKPLNRAWTNALKKAGITHRRLYELRHSFASNMLVAGLPVAFISKMIGHANPATTYSYYAADVEAMRPQYALKMAEAVTGN